MDDAYAASLPEDAPRPGLDEPLLLFEALPPVEDAVVGGGCRGLAVTLTLLPKQWLVSMQCCALACASPEWWHASACNC